MEKQEIELTPLEQAEKLARMEKRFKDNIVFEIAMQDMGLERYAANCRICEELGWTEEQLKKFREEHIDDIREEQERLLATKYRFGKAINKRIELSNQLTDAILNQREDSEEDKKKIERITKALMASEAILPARTMETLARVGVTIETIGDKQKQDGNAAAQINVQFNNPAVREAEEDVKRIREERRKAIEVK